MAIDFVRRLIEEGRLDTPDYKRVIIHMIHGEEEIRPLGASRKLNAEWAFLKRLHGIGREVGADWLDRNFEKLGSVSTVDLRGLFQG